MLGWSVYRNTLIIADFLKSKITASRELFSGSVIEFFGYASVDINIENVSHTEATLWQNKYFGCRFVYLPESILPKVEFWII